MSFTVQDWNIISLLVKLLEPFYDATIELQTQKYPTLSKAKIIENSLFEFFESKTKASNNNQQERWISEKIFDNLNNYLVSKTSKFQKNSILVYLVHKIFIKYTLIVNIACRIS